LIFCGVQADRHGAQRAGCQAAGRHRREGTRWGSPLALPAERQPLRLPQAFAAIGDKGARRSLMQLAEQIAAALPRRRG
jgi:hypothetical protein